MLTKNSTEWRPVVGWEELYEVSNGGAIRSLDRRIVVLNPIGVLGERNYKGRLLQPHCGKNGYRLVSFTAPGRKRASLYVHDIVARAFIGPKPTGLEICHNNGARTDNRVENLRYDTTKGNAADRKKHGTDKIDPAFFRRGVQVHNAKLTDDGVRRIRAEHPAKAIRQLAREYGVNPVTIQQVLRRNTWRHVTEVQP